MAKQEQSQELRLSPAVAELLRREALHVITDPTKQAQPWVVPTGTKMLLNVFEPTPKGDDNDD